MRVLLVVALVMLSVCKEAHAFNSPLFVSALRSRFMGDRLQLNRHEHFMSTSFRSHAKMSWNHRNILKIANKKERKDFKLKSTALTVSLASTFSAIRNDPWYVWMLLSLASSLGILSERTNIGATLSSPLTTTLITMALCNIGLLPPKSSVYNIVLKVLVPLAIPLLLLDADLKKCIKRTGSLFKAFLIGTLGTVIGTIVAYVLVPMKGLKGAPSIAAALCARHIGGAVNFVAVSEVLATPADTVAAALAADNFIVALYFTLLFAITTSGPSPSVEQIMRQSQLESPILDDSSIPSIPDQDQATTVMIAAPESTLDKPDEASFISIESNEISLTNLSLSLTLSIFLYGMSHLFGTYSPWKVSPIVIVSVLIISIATLFPLTIGSLSQSGGVIGVLFMQLFFSVIGSMGHIPTVIKIAPSLFLHTATQIFVHFVFILSARKLFGISFNDMMLASNANIGGPTTAAAMASNKRWPNLILPALLTGVFGYAIATVVGLLVSRILPFLPTR